MAKHKFYVRVRPYAESVKILAQMVVGGALFVILATKLSLHAFSIVTHRDICYLLLSSHPLKIVGYGLAVSAGIELAYMLFTPGPDEAVEPVILGIAAAILLIISQENIVGWEISMTIVSLSASLSLLFYVRERFIRKDTE